MRFPESRVFYVRANPGPEQPTGPDPGSDLESPARTALEALHENEARVGHAEKMEARFRLWELTNDKTHLIEAKRLLDFAVAHSPEEYRRSMLENVPLHRDIMKAWEEHGEKG